MLFNKYNTGGDELRELLGFIDASTNFKRWITWVELTVRQVTSLTGVGVYDVLDAHYNSDHYEYNGTGNETELTTPKLSDINKWKMMDGAVRKFQLANALFAYVRLLPSLDAGHGNGGRKKTIGETEKGLTAVEQYKDETNILNLGYEALEDLLSYLETNAIQEWLASETRKSTANLLVPTLEIFNQYFKIDSARLFYTLVPMIREVQNRQVVPLIKATRIPEILEAQKATDPTDPQKTLISITENYIRLPLVLATMALALKRLPVEILPEGIVQTQIVGTVKEKLIVNEKTRLTLIQSLEADAKTEFNKLQEQMAVLDGAVKAERYVEAAKVNENVKGFVL